MRPVLVAVLAIICWLVGLPSQAVAQDLGLVTGSEKGTYYQFGLNLQALAKQKGINLAVYPSKGSIQNVFAVYQRPGVQMGIVQSDVLAFVARVETDPVLKRIAKKTKMIFPLYNEEVHPLGRPGHHQLRRSGRPPGGDRPGGQRQLSDLAAAVPDGRGHAARDADHRHRGSAGRAQGRAHRRPGASTRCSTWPVFR